MLSLGAGPSSMSSVEARASCMSSIEAGALSVSSAEVEASNMLMSILGHQVYQVSRLEHRGVEARAS